MDAGVRDKQRTTQRRHGLCDHLCCLPLAEDVHHHSAADAELAVAKWKTQNAAQVLLELVDATRFHGVVSRVVRPRCDLIQQHITILKQEHLDAKDSTCIAETLDGIGSNLLCQLLLLLCHSDRRRQAGEANAIALDSVHDWIGAHGDFHCLVHAPCNHHGQLHLERCPLLNIKLLANVAAQLFEGRGNALRVGNDGIALAIVRTIPAFQHHRVTELFADGVQFSFCLDFLKVRQRHAMLLKMNLLHVLVLNQFHHEGQRLYGHPGLVKLLEDLGIDVLHFQRQDVTFLCQLADLVRILEAAFHRHLSHLPCWGLLSKRIEHAHLHS
mmetsp:Transcript_23585/g.44538  ORF Transcript_23585/g.44538 Transcript_23585/m.44538 type:complete len:327 (+) Transcript_23585:737-1717(+)